MPSWGEMTGLIGDTWALYTFQTAEAAVGGAEWGEAASFDEPAHFENSVVEPSPTTRHSINITGLAPAHKYHVRLLLRNDAGETNYTEPFILSSYDSRPDPSVPLWAAIVCAAGVLGTTWVATRRLGTERVAALAGLIGGLGIIAATLITAALIPGYGFGRNAISDLGDPPQGWVFNWAIVFFAPLGIIFLWGALRPALPGGALTTLGLLFGTVAMAAGILAGSFTERYPEEHLAVSFVVFAAGGAAALLLIRPAMHNRELKRLLPSVLGVVGAAGLILASSWLLNAADFVLYATVEAIFVFAFAGGVAALSWRLLPRRDGPDGPPRKTLP